MKSEMALKLKEILDNTTQEEFDREWNEIKGLGMQGPTCEEVLTYFTVVAPTSGSYELVKNLQFKFVAEESICLAA